jgi:tetratricopeptide (TPR) repeat protein
MPVLTGCRAPTATAQPEQPAAPAQPAIPSFDPKEVLALLDQAESALQREHMTYPAQGSALGLFDRALAIDPDNVEAQRGLERIVEYYLQKAEAAAQTNQLARARSMLDRARVVDAHHPAIEPTEIQLRLLTNAKRNRLRLDRAQLADRSVELGQPLMTLGIQARDSSCRATIRVRNDAEGRWVYQQMNLAPGDARIRAEIQIGSPPLVDLVCFHEH